RWTEGLRSHFGGNRWAEPVVGTSLATQRGETGHIQELELLLNEQLLRRHRQEFERILDIHDMIVRRIGACFFGGRWTFPNTEDGEELYKHALNLWRCSLSLSAGEDESEKDNLALAIARMHMAWACLMRGETVRAWHHSLRSRQFLNARGIAEHWWIGETERV